MNVKNENEYLHVHRHRCRQDVDTDTVMDIDMFCFALFPSFLLCLIYYLHLKSRVSLQSAASETNHSV